MIDQLEFEDKVSKFQTFEDTRSKIADSFQNMINSGFEIEAYLLILSTWNFAGFRYVLTKFKISDFKETLNAINPIFDKLRHENFRNADFDKLHDDIVFLYEKLNQFAKQTGTTKIMHFKVPDLFVMWDTAIRKEYKIPNKATASDYIEFLKLMKTKFSHLEWLNEKISFARAIDIYNFIITQEKIRKPF